MIDLSAMPWADLMPFVAIGFAAQIVDGALGMGFGVITNTALILMGVPPVLAGSTVRSVESFASGASGLSHAIRGNVDWVLFSRLAIPGIAGAVIGTWLTLHVGDALLRPVVFTYLGALGLYLLWRAPRRALTYRTLRMVAPVGFFGALVDATGGGWGPFVSGNLLAQGGNVRTVIGTVNAAEFFVTVTVLSAFIGSLGVQAFTIAASGLLIGSIVAAPFGAVIVGRTDPKLLLKLAGVFLIASCLYGLLTLTVARFPAFPRF